MCPPALAVRFCCNLSVMTRSGPPCLGATPLLFPEEETEENRPRFCATCPADHRIPCLRQGMSEEYGYWGGFSTEERQRARDRGIDLVAREERMLEVQQTL